MNNILGNVSGTLLAVALILLVLLVTSIVFNKQIERAGNTIEGWSWLLVVIGVSYTLFAMGLLDLVLDWNAGLLGLLAFSVSGFPMAYGAIQRYQDMQRRSQKAVIKDD